MKKLQILCMIMLAAVSAKSAAAEPTINLDLNKTTWGQNVLEFQWSKTAECDFFRQKPDNTWLTIQAGVTFGSSVNATAPLGSHTFKASCYSSKNSERQLLFVGTKTYTVQTTGNHISFSVQPVGDKPVKICLNDSRFSAGDYSLKTRNTQALINITLDSETCFDLVYADLNPAWGIYALDGFHYGDFVYDEGRYSATTYRTQTVGVNENQPIITTEVTLGAANFLLTSGLVVDEDPADGVPYIVNARISETQNYKFEAFDSEGNTKVMQGSVRTSNGTNYDLSSLSVATSLTKGTGLITITLQNAKRGDVIRLYAVSSEI